MTVRQAGAALGLGPDMIRHMLRGAQGVHPSDRLDGVRDGPNGDWLVSSESVRRVRQNRLRRQDAATKAARTADRRRQVEAARDDVLILPG